MGIPGLTPWLMFLPTLKYSKCCKVIFMSHIIGHFSKEMLFYQNLTVCHINSFFFSVFDFEHRLWLRLFILLVLRGDGYWGPVGQHLGELQLSNLVSYQQWGLHKKGFFRYYKWLVQVSPLAGDSLSMAGCMGMLLLDSVLYGLIMWYVTNIMISDI